MNTIGPSFVLIVASLCGLLVGRVDAQVRTAGQIVGTVKDQTGAVVPDAEIEIRDLGTGLTAQARSARDGAFVFPNLQPGRYMVTVAAGGFESAVIDSVTVQTGRSADVEVRVAVAGFQEEVQVQGRTAVIESTSTTISSTVEAAQIAKVPVGGRSTLVFAMLIPGAQQSASRTPGTTSPAARNSHINGLPGGAVNITLDGVNNNSARFRSGGTSIFTFAPTRLGAMEEVTVSTAGLTADAGAQGAVQIQFVTKRGSNAFRGQIFDEFQSDTLNANTPVNNARNLPKPKLRQHEFGFNLGGPILRNRLFFFGNYEQIHQPGETTLTRTVLTREAQQGIFRYVATDGSTRAVNLLEIAAANGFPGTISQFTADQFAAINATLGGGTLASRDLFRDNLGFINTIQPLVNIYPTARVDFQVSQGLAVRGVLNQHWRDLAQNPQFPGLERLGGFDSNYYILSTGADWTIRQNLFSQISVGWQNSRELYDKTNTLDRYEAAGMRRVIGQGAANNASLPLELTSPYLIGAIANANNNPVFNISNTFTWLKGSHTFTLGGTFRRTTTWRIAGGEPDFYNLGIASADPASGIFNATTIPGLRPADLANAQGLYAYLSGRISTISGLRQIDEDTKQYGPFQGTFRTAHNVGGLYVQDSFRWKPSVTLNYGLRWELTGAMHNTNDVYTSPTIEHLKGPSAEPFRPGVLDGVLDPQIFQQSHPYKADLFNFAPNVGAAWSLEPKNGFWGKLLGRSVLRGNFGMNYFDEGTVTFETAAGGSPGRTQTVSLNPGDPGFVPGGLSLTSPTPSLPALPGEFRFPMSQGQFTFTSPLRTVDPNIKTPYIYNWSIGWQRELWADAAVEVRYLGNAGRNLWRAYNLNEVNVFENGFLDEFRAAQRNLAINAANGRTGFANTGLPGQSALPMFDAAFGARGGQAALPTGSGYTNGTFVTLLQQGQAGRLANTLAGNAIYLCRMVGNNLSPCSGLGYSAPGVYPINLFQMNPYAAGQVARVLTDEARSRYDSLQVQFRQRIRGGLSLTANYSYGHARTDRFVDNPDVVADYHTLRDKALNWGPDIFDVRSSFAGYWTYELPFGRGRHFNIDNALLDHLLGGWAFSGVLRLQTGRPFQLTSDRWTVNQNSAGVVLNGVTAKELQKLVKVSPAPNGNVYFLDPKLIGPDGRANPQYLSVPTEPGALGEFVYLYGPKLFDIDFRLGKRINLGQNLNFNFETLLLSAFNNASWLVGNAALATGATLNIESTTFGQTAIMGAGPRAVVLRVQVNF